MHHLPDFDWRVLPEEAPVLVAASGGADSQTLLWALHAAGRNVTAAHINHGWRAESDDDERFVLEHCAAHGIPANSRRVQCARTEDAARQARYAALIEMAREQGCPLVAAGHTATDSLETMLLNLARGASVQGLAGIAPSRSLAEGITLVRPLWRISREEVHEALQASGWPHVEDASNASPDFARNRVRAALGQLDELPVLAVNAARSGEVLRDDLALLDEMADAAIGELSLAAKPGVVALNGDGYLALPIALQRRVLRKVAQNLGGSIGLEPIETTRRHVAAKGRRIVWSWPGGLRCEWTGEAAGNRLRLWRVGS